MKKKMLAILIAGLIVTTVFGAISASSAVIERRQAVRQVLKNDSPLNRGETGSVGAVVFYRNIVESSTIPELIFVEDASVSCKDKDGITYEMKYEEVEEVEPDFYAYVAYEVTEGQCEITAFYEGFTSKSINVEVYEGDLIIRKIELEKDGEKHRVFLRLLDLLPNAFLILRFLL